MANNLTGDIYSHEQLEEKDALTRKLFGMLDGSPLAKLPEVEPITADEKQAMLKMSKEDRVKFLADRKEQHIARQKESSVSDTVLSDAIAKYEETKT